MAVQITKKNTKIKKKVESLPQIKIHPPQNLPVWVVLIIFLATTVIFFWDQIFQQSFFWEDFLEYVFPVQSFAAKEFAHGNIPFWNPFTFAGMPFLADLQVGFFYPFNRILSLFVSNQGLPVIAIEAIIIIHFLIAQINMFFLSKYLKISTYGAIIAAISYSFSMLMVCHVIHPMIVYHLAWLPLILMFFIRGVEKKELSSAIISGTLFGFTMLSGHPQMTLYIGLLLGMVFVWFFVSGIKHKKINGLDYFTYFSAGIIPIILAAGIFCIQYLPSKELASLSQRNEITYEKATEGSLSFKNIYTSVIPKIFGSEDGSIDKPGTYYTKTGGSVQRHFYWETAYYFGLIALFLGFIGIIMKFRTTNGGFFLFIGLFGFLFALGSSGVVYNILYNFPFFNSFRNPARMMFLVVLSFSVLAGMGFDALWENIKAKKMNWVILTAVALPLLISILTATGFLASSFDTPEAFRETLISYGSTAVVITIIAYAIAFITNWKIIGPSIGGILFVILAFTDLYMSGETFNQSPQNPTHVYELKPELKSLLTPKLPDDLFRVNMRIYKPVSFMAMQRNQGLIDNVMLIEGYNPLILERASIPAIDQKTAYDLYNAKYEIKIDLDKGSWAFSPRDSYFKRVWFVNNAIIKKADEVKDFMKSQNIDFSNNVVLEENPGINLAGNPVDTALTHIKCEEYASNHFRYKVNTPVSSILCFSEIWYPDWKVFVDGKPTKLLRADYSLRAVAVPAGEHKVEMKFESEAYSKGKIISMLAIIFGIVGFFVTYHFERHRTADENELKKKENEKEEITVPD